VDTLKPLPIEPFPNPDPDARLAPPHKTSRVRPPFRPAQMGEGRPDRRPLRPEPKA